ncbi:MAG: RNA methyltransferase [Spirochaetaceae bacterium]|nr:MAG: RNA methyltransferase [Spirochaetaceae bacterium]
MKPSAESSRFDCVATTLPGLEAVLQSEIQALGAADAEPGHQAVRFSADRELLYRANLELRTALRVLVPLAEIRAADTEALYRGARELPWERYLTPQMTLAVRAAAGSPTSDDPRFAALKIKDAIVDRLRTRYGRRPSVDVRNPDLQVNLFWSREAAVISLDSSGESLHRRGYRAEQTTAPLSEVLAAGMVLLSGWDRRSTFYNPMCGSGTIAIEAALIGCGVAPGLLRRQLGFQRWLDYDSKLWQRLHAAAEQDARERTASPAPVAAGDIDPSAVRIAVRNLERTGFADLVRVMRRDFLADEPPKPRGETPVVLINPPYGKRLHEPQIDQLYAAIGDRLKQSYAGWKAWIISGNRPALKHIGLRAETKTSLYNGPIECSFRCYAVY